MKLSITTGEFQFENLIITPSSTVEEVLKLFSSDEIELRLANEGWSDYKITISEKYLFVLSFFHEKIRSIEIYEDGKDTADKIEDLRKGTLAMLGGENHYSWGKVILSNDIKAGYISVFIIYV